MSSYINIWNISDSKSDEEEKLKIDDPEHPQLLFRNIKLSNIQYLGENKDTHQQ